MLSAPPSLAPLAGKSIGQICPFSIGKDKLRNHCAHFVSHVMEYEFAETCKNFSFKDKHTVGKGAVIRVERLFNACPDVEAWADRPAVLTSCLIFVTVSSNVDRFGGRLRMKDNPKKHVGIFTHQTVWNYSNSLERVVFDPEKLFVDKFKHAYRTAGQTVEFYYGSFLK